MDPYQPWYFRKKPPIFCNCWKPIYECMFRPRRIIVLVASVLIVLGFILFLAALISCIAVSCSAGVIGLWPLAITLLWAGLLLFHCGWAAHLLDDPNESLPYRDDSIETPTKAVLSEESPPEAYQPQDQPDRLQTGYWQFVQKPAWQAVSSRDTLQ